MRIRKIVGVIGIISLCGCSPIENISLNSTHTVELCLEDSVSLDNREKELYNFFENYFSIDESILSRLHEVSIEDFYRLYMDIIKGKFDSDTLEVDESLGNGINYPIELPYKKLLNGYKVYGSGQLEEVRVQDIYHLAGEDLYDLEVISTHKMEELGSLDQERKLTNDKIRLKQYFEVYVDKGENLKIKKLRYKTFLKSDFQTENYVLKTQSVTALPYYEEITEVDRRCIEQVFKKLMTLPPMMYIYYDEVYTISSEKFADFWRNIELLNLVSIEESYRDAYPISINPYKEDIIQIESLGEISIEPSCYGTQLKPCFIVTIPTKALLANHQIVYYNYKYFIGIKKNKIEFINFMSIGEENNFLEEAAND